jgi:hypothetical protein
MRPRSTPLFVRCRPFLLGLLAAAVLGASPAPARGADPAVEAPLIVPMEVVRTRLARFAEAELGAPPGQIAPERVLLVRKLVEAADHVDRVFWRQMSEEGLGLYRHWSQLTDPDGQAVARLLRLNYGPWDRLDGDVPFLGVRPRPAGATYYPPDLSRREVDAWLDQHPEDLALFADPYTLVLREKTGFRGVPFSEAYRTDLDKAARALREAAALSPWGSLRTFLVARADALLTNRYFDSELLWMDTGDQPLLVVLGPYEVYEDRLLNFKAAFEAIIAWRDEAESARIGEMCEKLAALLPQLPLPPSVRSALQLTPSVPLTVADVLYTAGDTRAGAQTTAFSLPNDARVVEQKGRWKVVLRNVAQAKFLHSWLPLVKQVMAADQAAEVTFDSYFRLLLLGEFARGIRVEPLPRADGTKVDPQTALRQRYSVIEEARSDVLALLVGLTLCDQTAADEVMSQRLLSTYLGSVFRVLRFGSGPHETAKAIAFNFLAREGVFVYDPTVRRYRVDMSRAREATSDLAAGLIAILATGDDLKAGTLIAEYGVLPGDVREKLADLDAVPVDIFPVYTVTKPAPPTAAR